jgi:hypothetical protein
MVDRQMLTPKVFRLAQSMQKLDGIDIVPDARVRIYVLQGIDLERASLLARDYAARFIRRILPRLGDQKLQLFSRKDHFRSPPANLRFASAGCASWTFC